jgi:ABC-2 type transport system ATP-binding protein
MQSEPLIELQHVTRRFGSVVALDDVSLRVMPGRIGLLGPNGAGKSTLLKLIMGLIPPSAGSGMVFGHPLGMHDNPALRRRIGFLPEADALVPGLTGVEYVALAGELCGMPRQQAKRRAHEVLTYLELEDARYRKLEEYSLGMKQRIKLGQALVHDPPVLLLDEPTSGLDPAGRESMLRLLFRLGRDHDKSLILSTHLLGDVEQVCEQVIILYSGKVRGQGGVRELCARRHDRYRLQVQGDAKDFLEELALEGVEIVSNNGRGELRVAVPDGFVSRAFFALADNHGVILRGMERDDESVEEMFHRLVAD